MSRRRGKFPRWVSLLKPKRGGAALTAATVASMAFGAEVERAMRGLAERLGEPADGGPHERIAAALKCRAWVLVEVERLDVLARRVGPLNLFSAQWRDTREKLLAALAAW